MNFKEAMRLVADHPAGKGARGVARPGARKFVYMDSNLGLRSSPSPKVAGDCYSPSIEDIEAEDWQVLKIKEVGARFPVA